MRRQKGFQNKPLGEACWLTVALSAAQWDLFAGLFLESHPLGSRLFQEVAGVILGGQPVLARQTMRGS